MYLHQKMIRIYADIVQNHTLPGVFPNFWRAVYIYIYIYIYISGGGPPGPKNARADFLSQSSPAHKQTTPEFVFNQADTTFFFYFGADPSTIVMFIYG